MHSGHPQWHIRVNDKSYVWWKDGAFFFGTGKEEFESGDFKSLDNADAATKRWNLPEVKKEKNNCNYCFYYNGIMGSGPILDHGVCTSESSGFDGRVVKARFLCQSFSPMQKP